MYNRNLPSPINKARLIKVKDIGIKNCQVNRASFKT